MRITLNGEPYDVAAPISVAALLAHLGLDARRVAVEHNLVVVKRAAYAETMVMEGDAVEIVNFVGGGERRKSLVPRRKSRVASRESRVTSSEA